MPRSCDRLGDVGRLALERELGRMDADHDQPVLAVALVPRLHIGDRAQAVDAAVGPEVDHHDLALAAARGSAAALLNHGPSPSSGGKLRLRPEAPARPSRWSCACALVHRLARARACARGRIRGSRSARSRAWRGRACRGRARSPRRRPAPARRAPGGCARSRRATSSSARTPCRRPAARAPARSPRRAHRRAAASVVLTLAPLKRGGGEDDAEDRPGAGRPEQAGGDAEHRRRPDAVLLARLRVRTAASRARRAAGSAGRRCSGRPARCRTARAGSAPPSGRPRWRAPPSRRRPPRASRRSRRSPPSRRAAAACCARSCGRRARRRTAAPAGCTG